MEAKAINKNGVKYLKYILKTDFVRGNENEWQDHSEWYDSYSDHAEYAVGYRDDNPIYG